VSAIKDGLDDMRRRVDAAHSVAQQAVTAAQRVEARVAKEVSTMRLEVTDSQEAMKALDARMKLSLRQGRLPRAGPATDKVFVGGLPHNCSEDVLRLHFQVCGNIIDAVGRMAPPARHAHSESYDLTALSPSTR